MIHLSHPCRCVLPTLALLTLTAASFAQKLDPQPFRAQINRVEQALESIGQPLPAEIERRLAEAKSDAQANDAIQQVLDPLCLVMIDINAESRVKIKVNEQIAAADRKLIQHGWTAFLVKVTNVAGVTAPLRVTSPNSLPPQARSTGAPVAKRKISPTEVEDRWLIANMFDSRPMTKTLSGLGIEYRIVQLYSRDAGQREAQLAFDVGQGTDDLGFRNAVPILFDCRPAHKVRLAVIDDDGTPATAGLIIKDASERVYPARSRRLEPDFFFHDQIYRQDGDELLLPAGTYNVTWSRGPEYLDSHRQLEVRDDDRVHTETFRLKRWIHMARYGWYSGDHHIHAAGCSHYEAPTQGVTPEAMMRHVLGEDLNVGCVLSWGPCWYHQKQFFEGKDHEISTKDTLLRYDVEVSGFPSSHAGHLCLLRLEEDDYPGTTKIEQWPSWDLPVLQWGKEQGGVVGFSHSGWGLEVPGDELPNYNMPRFDGIGANEYIVDVTHDACDFISAVDTPIIWELSPWYHTLNCGYTCRISGETDFPCIYDQKVGLGRSYVKLDKLDFDAWVDGVKAGRSYVGDGLSHLFDFAVNDFEIGQMGVDGRASVLAGKAGDELKIKVNVAAYLGEKPDERIRGRSLSEKPYWHLERARIGNSRRVPVELIVNGRVAATTEIKADGKVQELTFAHRPQESSWIAVRIFASSHTNPIFVELDDQPVRCDKKSAEWCVKAVDVCWESKQGQIRDSEKAAARAAYDHAKREYEKIVAEFE